MTREDLLRAWKELKALERNHVMNYNTFRGIDSNKTMEALTELAKLRKSKLSLLSKNLNKKANFLDDTKDYLKSNYDYGKYLFKHKWNVYRAGSQLDLPFIQLAMHDYNKLTPGRWNAYRKWMHTSEGRNGMRDPELYKEFRQYADEHIQSVPYGHHWYRDKTPIEKVPIEYRLESLADWYSVYASNASQPVSFKTWYKKHRDTLPLDPVAKSLADQKLIYGI